MISPLVIFYDYISGVCRSTHFHLRNIGRIRSLLSYEATAQLLHALITTRIDYCNSLLYNLPKCSIARLQKIQNQAAQILTRTPRCDHISIITEVLINLHWLKVEQRIIYKILIMYYFWMQVKHSIVFVIVSYLIFCKTKKYVPALYNCYVICKSIRLVVWNGTAKIQLTSLFLMG